MGKRRSAQDAELEAIYAQVPEVNCKGLCQYACTAIDMTPRERERIAAEGVTISAHQKALEQMRSTGDFACEALTGEGRCEVYERRPMVCRVWGTTEPLACAHGCVPEGGWLPYAQTLELMNAVQQVGRGKYAMPTGAITARLDREPELARALEDAARTAHISPRSPFRRNA